MQVAHHSDHRRSERARRLRRAVDQLRVARHQAEWGLGRRALGFVLSAELFGMALGSIFLGGLADKIGRRPTVLGCLVVMATGMYMVTTSSGVLGGFVTPIVRGVRRRGRSAARGPRDLAGHHGARHRRHARRDQRRGRGVLEREAPRLLASRSCRSATRSARRSAASSRRPGSTLANWRSVFLFGAGVTLVFIPIVFFFMPESVHWLARKQPEGALEKINRTLKQDRPCDGRGAAGRLRRRCASARSPTSSAAASSPITVIVTLAYFFHITTFYFIVK